MENEIWKIYTCRLPNGGLPPEPALATAFGDRPSLHPHTIALGAAESFGSIHLFRLGRRHHEQTRRGGPGEVTVLVHAFPKDGSESFGAFVAQVLVFKPGAVP